MGKTRLHFRGRTPLVAAQKISINAPKSRASRDSATDPQSLYARVDVSTMLEEAVQYVKFLQLQIKGFEQLLSSDDLRMYSPIAYNGMDIGLDLKMGTTKS
ncbi:transcription factor bHLH84-like isoform X1 [Capsicum annuum]|uniref:transcription factor bHLH84-like isoform X1 n=1 Tax=Capsicum annuum TaxID=4072 RepID=UPI001FB06C14|nr:transcription factor bHLH84-like isoform X1 [Capsicum annuum]